METKHQAHWKPTARFNLELSLLSEDGARCTESLSAQHECYGGAPRIMDMVKQVRKKFGDEVLLLDAGDQFQGTIWFYVFGGFVSSVFMNAIGYDAMAVGNHEFDRGVEGLVPFARNLKFPLLSSNIILENTPELQNFIKKSTVITKKGKKIGIVGYTTPETPSLSKTETVNFTEELGAIQKEVDKLTAQGIDIIIALGHSGYKADIELGEQLKDVDIVVGGHTNTFLYNGIPPRNDSEDVEGPYPTIANNIHDGRKVLVVQDYAYGKYLGELHVTFDDQGNLTSWSGNPILLDHTVKKDPKIMDLIKQYLPKIAALRNEIIGRTVVDLMADKRACRTTECTLGSLIADAWVHQNLRQHDSEGWAEAGIAFVNAASLRTPIATGDITNETVIMVQPFRNPVEIINITGQGLFNIFEFCASQWTEGGHLYGGFLQVSGLRITYDMRRPVGRRVVELMVICTECKVPKFEPVDRGKVYKALTSSFIIDGGDGLNVVGDNVLGRRFLGRNDTHLLLDYIKTISLVSKGLDGRIRHLKDVQSPLYCPSGSDSGAEGIWVSRALLLIGMVVLVFLSDVVIGYELFL